ncbi:MAG: bifunctional UDP-N-acetylglucosamine diphosphorylase/glucosamine-1-phosphate N-acetyltransferase GlmU [Fusobacteriaceae bacterium]
MKLKSLILAAGKGTRMKSELPKVIHKVNGIPMVKKIMNTLDELEVEENILILGHKKEVILKVLGDVSYVEQKEQLGTGHAIKMAEEKLKNYDGDILVVCGDSPLVKKDTLQKLYDHHKKSGATTTLLTSIYENPFGYGRIVRKDEKIIGIVEEKDASEEIKKIKEVNAAIYCFKNNELWNALAKVDNNNSKKEYYLTDVIKIQASENKKIEACLIEDHLELLGINSKVELALANKVLRERKNESLMEDGVIIIDPATTYIEDSVQVGRDTIIYPGVILQGETSIGENCQIIGNTRIINSNIKNEVIIESSVIEESILEDKVTVGPFAHLRPKTHLKESVHIGNFVEVKKSTLEKGVKAGHLTYLGDATIGESTNIGAGTITCNYDGKNKFPTIIGKKVFIGSDTMLVAPVKIGDEAITGAGSVITKDVTSKALAIGRSRQIELLDWRKD